MRILPRIVLVSVALLFLSQAQIQTAHVRHQGRPTFDLARPGALKLHAVPLERAFMALAPDGNYSLSAGPSPVHDEKPETVSWTAPDDTSTTDWIGLFKIGDPDSGYISYVYTHAATSGSWTSNAPAPVSSGLYEYRYFLNNGYTRVATSNTVTVINHTPTATGDSYTVHGLGALGPFLANDSDPDGDPLSMGDPSHEAILTLPEHGTLGGSTQADRKSYSPLQGYVGPDSFTYQACDPYGLCSVATVNINVVNEAPVPVDDSYSVRGFRIIGPLLVNDFDPDGDAIFGPDILTFPAHGRLYGLAQPDLKSYTPEPGYTGTDSFTYRIREDFWSFSSTATVTLYVVAEGENNGATSCNARIGRPINVTNGNMYVQQSDYHLPSAGPAIDITRTYNSMSQRMGLFGKGWSTAYDESITAYDGNLIRLNQADGRAIYLGRPVGAAGVFTPLEGDFHGQIAQGGGSFTLAMKDGSVHQFNAGGKLLSVADRNGNTTALSYDTNSFLSSVTDPFGRVLAITTNASGQALSISDTLGTIANYTYAAGNELLSTTYADNSGFQFSYDGSSRLTSITDALGNPVEAHTYDSLGRALTSETQGGVDHYSLDYVTPTETDVTDALGHVSKYTFDTSKGRNVVTQVQGLCSCGGGSQTQNWTYDDQLSVTSKTNALGQATTYSYDPNGNQLTETNSLGTRTFTYNALSEVLAATDQMGGATTNTFDAQGNLLTTKDALNNTTTLTYDTRGQLQTVTDARGKITTLTWDTSGRLTQVKDALNNTTGFTYDARARRTSATNALNQTTSYAYDAAGRLNKITYPDTNFVQFTYDLAGRRTKIKDARGNDTNYGYDSAYRQTSLTNAASAVTSYSYDLMSNLTGVTDALGRTVNYSYDEFNQLKQITYPEATAGVGHLTELFAYDAGGNLTQKTDQAGRITTLAYDSANRLTSATDAALKVTSYEYNARSQMTALVDALNQRYTFAYDALGRTTQTTCAGVSMSYVYDAVGNRTQRTDYNGAVTNYTYDNLNRLTAISYPDTTNVSYGYDALSRLSSATNANGTVTFSYDNRGRLANTSDVFNQTIGYSYDPNGNRTAMTLGGSAYANYVYDAVNRLTRISDNAGLAFNYAYDATNKLSSRTLPNGVATTFEYDGLNRLTHLRDAKGATTIADNQYQFSSANQIVQDVDQGGTHAYGYDAVDRLTSATYPGTTAESYSFDGVGNRTSSHLSTTYGYQSFNKLISTATVSYSYDNNGNLTSKTDASGTTQFTWDFENRLKQVTLQNANIVAYKYDALARRIERGSSVSLPIPLATATRFIYDGADVIQDKDANGMTTASYLNGPGIDDKLRQTGTTDLFYYITDRLGSTRALTDSLGNVLEQEQYDSFGNSTGSALTRYGYTGRELDPDTGLTYYRARWYDSQVGRFISEDPIQFNGHDVNLYGYVKNNPLSDVDPSGRELLTARQYEIPMLPPHPPTPSIDYYGVLFGDGGILTGSTLEEFLNARERARQPCKRFGERFAQSFSETNEALPGAGAPPGLGLITAPKLAQISGEPGLLRLAFNGFDPPSALPGALARFGGNKLAVSAAFEGGIAVGSFIDAAGCPCGY